MARHWLTKHQSTVVGVSVAIGGIVAMSAAAYAHIANKPAPAPADNGVGPVTSPDQIPDQTPAPTGSGDILVSQYAVQNGQCYRVDFTANGSTHTPVDMSLCQSTPDITQ